MKVASMVASKVLKLAAWTVALKAVKKVLMMADVKVEL